MNLALAIMSVALATAFMILMERINKLDSQLFYTKKIFADEIGRLEQRVIDLESNTWKPFHQDTIEKPDQDDPFGTQIFIGQ